MKWRFDRVRTIELKRVRSNSGKESIGAQLLFAIDTMVGWIFFFIRFIAFTLIEQGVFVRSPNAKSSSNLFHYWLNRTSIPLWLLCLWLWVGNWRLWSWRSSALKLESKIFGVTVWSVFNGINAGHFIELKCIGDIIPNLRKINIRRKYICILWF